MATKTEIADKAAAKRKAKSESRVYKALGSGNKKSASKGKSGSGH